MFKNISPLFNRSTFIKKLKEEQKPHFIILFNMYRTKASNPLAEKIRAMSINSGKDLYYTLMTRVLANKQVVYQLQGNVTKKLITPEGKYAYVIVLDQGRFSLRIGKGHHYYLADKSFEVFAAGEIQFLRLNDLMSEITSINDYSGGYHHEDTEKRVIQMKQSSVAQVLKEVGLPEEKFAPYTQNTTFTRRNSI